MRRHEVHRDVALGYSPVAYASRHKLGTAIETLDESLKDSRDYLFRAGVALTDIADEYFDREELHEQMMNSFNTQLNEVDMEAFPRYPN